jgi:hypothetical protein
MVLGVTVTHNISYENISSIVVGAYGGSKWGNFGSGTAVIMFLDIFESDFLHNFVLKHER